MCVGIPMQVKSIGVGTAICEGRNGQDKIDLMTIGEVAVGDWILAWNHKAIRAISADEASTVDDALSAVEAIMNGQEPDMDQVQAGFGDLMAGSAHNLSADFLKQLTK